MTIDDAIAEAREALARRRSALGRDPRPPLVPSDRKPRRALPQLLGAVQIELAPDQQPCLATVADAIQQAQRDRFLSVPLRDCH